MTSLERIRASLQRLAGVLRARPAAAAVTATTRARGLGGLRCRIEDGEWRFEMDQPKSFGGGGTAADPGAFGRAAFAGCLVQCYQIWFALRGVPLQAVEVEVSAAADLRGLLGLDPAVPPGYGNLHYVVRIASPAAEAEIAAAVEAAERHSPWRDNFARPLAMKRRLEINGGPTG